MPRDLLSVLRGSSRALDLMASTTRARRVSGRPVKPSRPVHALENSISLASSSPAVAAADGTSASRCIRPVEPHLDPIAADSLRRQSLLGRASPPNDLHGFILPRESLRRGLPPAPPPPRRRAARRARGPADQVRLKRLVGDALPASDAAAVSGSVLLHRSPALPPFAVHIKLVDGPQPDYGTRHVAALVLICRAGARRHRVDPDLVARPWS